MCCLGVCWLIIFGLGDELISANGDGSVSSISNANWACQLLCRKDDDVWSSKVVGALGSEMLSKFVKQLYDLYARVLIQT